MKQFWRSDTWRTIWQSVLILLAVIGCCCWPLLLNVQFAAWPQSWFNLAKFCLFLSLSLPFIWFALCGVMPVCTFIPLFMKQHRGYRRLIPAYFVSWIILWSSIWLFRAPVVASRKTALTRMAQNAKPVIAAIEAYRAKTGRYPNTLTDLTPQYIAEIPYTGAVGYPDFEYKIYSKGELFKSYELFVDTPGVGINWDKFVYWPEQGYPARMYGGWIERSGDWAYVHE